MNWDFSDLAEEGADPSFLSGIFIAFAFMFIMSVFLTPQFSVTTGKMSAPLSDTESIVCEKGGPFQGLSCEIVSSTDDIDLTSPYYEITASQNRNGPRATVRIQRITNIEEDISTDGRGIKASADVGDTVRFNEIEASVKKVTQEEITLQLVNRHKLPKLLSSWSVFFFIGIILLIALAVLFEIIDNGEDSDE